MTSFLKILFNALLVISATVFNASAYEVIDVNNGGSIKGSISFKGDHSLPALKITKDTDFCGQSVATDHFMVGANGGLANAVVSIEKIEKGKAYNPQEIVPFDNKKCMFTPHVTTAVKGQKLGVNNSDPLLHNTHLYQGKKNRTLYNIALPLQNKVIKKSMKKPGLVTVKCDAHEWMLGYIYVTNHPYSAATGADGKFVLDNVPPGTYQINIWHEKLGVVSKEVTVAANKTSALDHEFSQP